MTKHFYLRNNQKIDTNTELSATSKELLQLEKAEGTITAYEADWNDFCDWCQHQHVQFFPATPETIVNYINDLSRYAKANTISRRISAISENYLAGGVISDNPCASPLVKAAMKSIRRKIGTFQQGKEPIMKEDLLGIISLLKTENLVDLRDKTLLLIGFMGAFRRSELVGIQVKDLTFERRGLEIFIPHSKADQEGRGSLVALPFLSNKKICPVQTMKQWLEVSGIVQGPVFRGFTRSGNIREQALSDQMVNRIVKERVAQIGLNPDEYGAHSLRHGFATSAAIAGTEERRIMQQTRHHSVEMVRHYINEADRFSHNPLTDIFGS